MTQEQSKKNAKAQKSEQSAARKMQKREVLINTSFRRLEPILEDGFSPSETVPNQAMSVKEILLRFSKGQDVGGRRNDSYTEEDFTEITGLDTFEKLDLAKEIRQNIRQQQAELQQQQNPTQTQQTQQTPKSNDVDDVV